MKIINDIKDFFTDKEYKNGYLEKVTSENDSPGSVFLDNGEEGYRQDSEEKKYFNEAFFYRRAGKLVLVLFLFILLWLFFRLIDSFLSFNSYLLLAILLTALIGVLLFSKGKLLSENNRNLSYSAYFGLSLGLFIFYPATLNSVELGREYYGLIDALSFFILPLLFFLERAGSMTMVAVLSFLFGMLFFFLREAAQRNASSFFSLLVGLIIFYVLLWFFVINLAAATYAFNF